MRAQLIRSQIFLIAFLTLFGCSQINSPEVKEMTVQDLKEHLDSGEPLELYDVRTPEEIATAKIAGAVVFSETIRRTVENGSKVSTIVLFCHHGGRSRKAAEALLGHGHKNVYNLVGGIDAWSREIDPTVSRY